jgi:hypothetical protein
MTLHDMIPSQQNKVEREEGLVPKMTQTLYFKGLSTRSWSSRHLEKEKEGRGDL